MIIEAIHIKVTTDSGIWERYLSFLDDSLTLIEVCLIYGDNERGKSTLLKSIIYALGGENIYGINKTTKSNLTAAITQKIGNSFVKSSEIFLQIINKKGDRIVISRDARNRLEPIIIYQNVTIKSLVNNKNVKIERYKTEKDRDIEGNKTFNEFIMGFLGFPIFAANNNKGKATQIYFHNLLSLFFVHQYAWNDVQATNPTYGVFEMKSLVFQIILNLSGVALIEDKLKLQKIKEELSEKIKLKEQLDDIILAAEFGTSESISKQLELFNLDLNFRRKELKKLNETKTSNEQSFNPLKAEFRILNYEISDLKNDIETLDKSINQYSYYINKVNMDIEKTDKLRTAKRIISNIPIKQCPHCLNNVDINAEKELESGNCTLCGKTMQIKNANFKELIDYLKNERNDFIKLKGKKEKIKKRKEKRLFLQEINVKEIKQRIDKIEFELTPKFLEQYYLVSNKIGSTENKIGQFEKERKVVLEYEALVVKVNNLMVDKKALEDKIRKEKVKNKDDNKLKYFQTEFKSILRKIDFLKYELEVGGKEKKKKVVTDTFFQRLLIDRNNYKPKIEGENLYFLTSASGIIRLVNAYYLALLKTSLKFIDQTNHPRVLILDEPLQQNLDPNSYQKLTQLYLDLADEYSGQFQIIFASGTKGAISDRNILLDLYGTDKYLIQKV